MDSEDILTTREFIYYLSPRYFRLLFPKIKPPTKNGDLVAALNEMRADGILTRDSRWESIDTTKKGGQYKKLIKKLMEMDALYRDDSNGLFDYRSETGREVIVKLIRFLAARLNFNKYFRYLNLPVLQSEQTKDWMEIFDGDAEKSVDYLKEEGKEQLEEYISKSSGKYRRKFKSITKKISKQDNPIKLNATIIKKYLKRLGLNRPTPLLNHFNRTPEPRVFSYEDRDFYVNISMLSEYDEMFESYLEDWDTSENKWLNDYFDMLKIPAKFFGFQKSDFNFASREVDAFLNLAIQAPRIFASQFTEVKGIGELRLIVFPINPTDNLVIYAADLGIIYYFTIPISKCNFAHKTNFFSYDDFPDSYRTSRKRFGKLLERSKTIQEVILEQKIEDEPEKTIRKELESELKELKESLKSKIKLLSHHSASFFTVCQAIAQKFTPDFDLNKAICIYEHGLLSFHYITSDTILTNVNLGEIELGKQMTKIIDKIDDSIENIIDTEENIIQ